jgi:hypothetical protein
MNDFTNFSDFISGGKMILKMICDKAERHFGGLNFNVWRMEIDQFSREIGWRFGFYNY